MTAHERRPQVQQFGPALLLQGPVLHELRWVLEVGAREISRRDALSPSAAMQALRHALISAITAHGNEELPPQPDLRRLNTEELGEWLTTEEVASLLGRQPRQVRNLAAQLGGRRHGTAWRFERAAVEAEIARRKEASR